LEVFVPHAEEKHARRLSVTVATVDQERFFGRSVRDILEMVSSVIQLIGVMTVYSLAGK